MRLLHETSDNFFIHSYILHRGYYARIARTLLRARAQGRRKMLRISLREDRVGEGTRDYVDHDQFHLRQNAMTAPVISLYRLFIVYATSTIYDSERECKMASTRARPTFAGLA